MAPLLVLLIVFGVTFMLNRFFLKDRLSMAFIGRLALSVMLVFTGISHFTSSLLLVAMMPDFVPWKTEVVYITGVIEFMAAVGLLIKRYVRLTSLLLIIFFLALLPANIAGSLKQVPLGGMEHGVSYLYFRIPLQLLFIFWAYYFGIRNK